MKRTLSQALIIEDWFSYRYIRPKLTWEKLTLLILTLFDYEMYSFTGPTVHSFRPALDEFIQEETGTGIWFSLMYETVKVTLTFV